MPNQPQQHTWDLWIADVGATGISFARGRMNATDVVIVHAAPEQLNVEVRDADGNLLAKGESLKRTTNSPLESNLLPISCYTMLNNLQALIIRKQVAIC